MKTTISYKKIWTISAPLMVSLLVQNVITLTDTLFLGHVGELELGASAIGGLYYSIIFMIGFGFGIGTQIMVARRNGEQRYGEIGGILTNSAYFMLVLAFSLIIISAFVTPLFFSYSMASKNVAELANQYLTIRVFGLIFSLINILFRAFFVGVTHTKFLSWNAALMAIVNIILNYFFIFGNGGFPVMGIQGAALASVCAEAVSVIFFFIITRKFFDYKKYNLFGNWKIDFKSIGVVLKLSIFIMLQYLLSQVAWFIFFMIIEKAGERPLAVSNIIRSTYNMILLPIWAFSSTCNSLVSNIIGENREDEVMPLINKITLFSTIFVTGCSIIAYLFSPVILKLFTNNAGLIADSQIPYIIICFSAISMALGYTYFSGIAGTGKTNMAMYVETGSIIIYLTFVMMLARTLPVEWVWISEFVYGGCLFAFSLLYFRFGKWRNVKI